MSKTMMKNKRTIYRHPETNKFISKTEWEKLTGMQSVQTVQSTGSDFDVEEKYIKETKEFMKNIEEDFNKLTSESVETIPTQEEKGWKLLFSKLKFWQ
jgi:ferredoxin-NADP reductase